MLARAQPETEPPKLQQPSGRARPEFAWTRFAFIAQELPPLFEKHWREVALNHDSVPLSPDWERYFQLDAKGILQVLTVRVDGDLVGYHFLTVYPHLHYAKTWWAETDIFWLHPDHRQGLTGYKLLKLPRDWLRAAGVKHHTLRTKLHIPSFEPILQRLGYVPIETVYSLKD
jgi:hypothetical protein